MDKNGDEYQYAGQFTIRAKSDEDTHPYVFLVKIS